jgi:hypothetical protein
MNDSSYQNEHSEISPLFYQKNGEMSMKMLKSRTGNDFKRNGKDSLRSRGQNGGNR